MSCQTIDIANAQRLVITEKVSDFKNLLPACNDLRSNVIPKEVALSSEASR